MTVSFPNDRLTAVKLTDLAPALGAFVKESGTQTESHRTAQMRLADLRHVDHYRVCALGIQFGRVGTLAIREYMQESDVSHVRHV